MGRLIKFLSKTLLSLMMMISVVMVGSTDISAIAPDPKIPTAENRVTVDKYAELVPGKVNTWDITLDVPEGFIRIVNGFTITNVYVELPDTGAVSTQWYTFGGIGAGLAGMLLLITKRKKEDE